MNTRAATLPDTTLGIGRLAVEALLASAGATIMNAADLQTYGIQYVWAAIDNAPAAGIAGGFYIPERTGEDHHPEISGLLAWVQANHPDWISYGPLNTNLAGAVQIAYEFGEQNIPFDIANSAVRDYIWTTNLQPALAAGYKAISFDSVTAVLTFMSPSLTIRSGHYQVDGVTYVTQYNPTNSADTQFAADAVTFMTDMTSRIHGAGGLIAANMRMDNPSTRTTMQSILALIDIWLDEQTATNFGGARLNGAAWLQHQNDLAAKAKTDAIAVDSLYSYSLDSQITSDDMVWALANYLTAKGTRSYVSISATSVTGKATNWQHPEFAAVQAIGMPLEDCLPWNGVYLRTFSGGIVLVNPTLSAVSVPIPAGIYRDLYGRLAGSTLVLGPTAGAILLNGKSVSSPEYNAIGRLRVP